MVCRVEVEIFGFLPFSNWPDVDQKLSKIGHFGPQNVSKLGSIDLFWSLNEVVGDLRNYIRSFVRDAVSRKPFLTFF